MPDVRQDASPQTSLRFRQRQRRREQDRRDRSRANPVDDDPPPIRKKKKKRFRGPSGEVSVLLVPLGGVAVLFAFGVLAGFGAHEAKEQKVEAGVFAYGITLVAAFIGLSVGGTITSASVNSLARKNRVPELEFAEAVCLYPLVAAAGTIGLFVVLFTALSFLGKAEFGARETDRKSSWPSSVSSRPSGFRRRRNADHQVSP